MVPRILNGGENSLFNKQWCENWISTCKIIKLGLYLIPLTQVYLKWRYLIYVCLCPYAHMHMPTPRIPPRVVCIPTLYLLRLWASGIHSFSYIFSLLNLSTGLSSLAFKHFLVSPVISLFSTSLILFSFFLIIVLFKNNFIFAVLTSSPAIHF